MAYKHFNLETDGDGITLAIWDSPDRSMNVIDIEVMEEWKKIIDQVSEDETIKGVVLTSGKKAFGAGADLTMIQAMLGRFQELKVKDPEAAAQMLFDGASKWGQVLRKQETCGKPFVAAINGQALGGVFEMTLACHARVIVDDAKAKVGLPEVKIGLFPGAGGTQRLPRMIHTQDALQNLLKGSNIYPAKAKKLGIANELTTADELISTAKQLIIDGLKGVQPWDVKGFKLPGGKVFSPAGFQLIPAANAIYRRETQDNYPGARAIMKCVYEGLLLPMDLALKVESRYFAEILTTTEAAMMVRTLFHSLQSINKGMRRPAGQPESNLKKVGILGGGGFMGAGIGYVTAKAGLEVVLLDRDLEAAQKGIAHCEELEDKAISKKRSTNEKKTALLSNLSATDKYEDISDCDLIIEAVFEDSNVKKTVTEACEKHMKAGAVFASNTSTIPITDLAKKLRSPRRFHWHSLFLAC